ncbi:UPF0481 protein At3g47200-like [Mangifera indica]|uniref:UPF0481 protein At3g47200-like n=1 Tax=Mangifera indica TaxID=29780 RepID=UPI001CFAC75F|nr:UPF0481 protein At3g47200-like [Mangifera indica]
MNLKLTASSKHEQLVNELRSDMEKNLVPELHPNQCCIYRVLKDIRKVNEQAYTSQMVSIGPLHHRKKELVKMEKKKRSYMKSFLEERINIEKQDNLFSFVQNNENIIRNCYAETSNLNNYDFIMMILYDAIFIIELFMRNFERTSDSILSTTTIRIALTSDLELLENQLLFFVLEEIYKLTFCFNMPTFMDISGCFFGSFKNLELIELNPRFRVKHFTDWRRCTLLKKYPRSDQNYEYIPDLPCAMKLHESGVKFQKTERVKFEKHKHELQLPQLEIADGVECLLRNVMALEQYHYPNDTHICNYIQLMDRLIDTTKDVDLLVESEIISNSIGDNSSIAKIFNKLGRNISLSPSSYYNMCQELKKHCEDPWNRKMATLRRVYFSNLWRGTGTIAGVLLLLLTVIQTICSILQLM